MLNHTNADDEGSNASSDYREWNPPHMRKHESRLSSVLKKDIRSGKQGRSRLVCKGDVVRKFAFVDHKRSIR